MVVRRGAAEAPGGAPHILKNLVAMFNEILI